MSASKPAKPESSLLGSIMSVAGKLIGKVICIFDDIPFLIKGMLSKSMQSIGSYALAGAGFVAFPVELKEGIQGVMKAKGLSRRDPKRAVMLSANVAKISFSVTGLLVSGGLLAATLLKLVLAQSILSVGIPFLMTLITATEFKRKLHDYTCANRLLPGKGKEQAVTKATRGLVFSSIFLALSICITTLAAMTTIAAMGLAPLGAVPVLILMGVVGTALGLKIFQIADKKTGFVATNAIGNLFSAEKKPAAVATPGSKPSLGGGTHGDLMKAGVAGAPCDAADEQPAKPGEKQDASASASDAELIPDPAEVVTPGYYAVPASSEGEFASVKRR